MTKQKIVTVNVLLENDKVIRELELPLVNKYLEEGYQVKDKIAITPPHSSNRVNITFILEKEEV